jgi:hypothetical protein
MLPTLDELTANPAKAAALPPDAVPALLAELASRQHVLSALSSTLISSLVLAQKKPTAFDPEDEMLEPDAAAELLHKTRQWLFRHKRLPFVRVISRKSILCSKKGLLKWLASQKA